MQVCNNGCWAIGEISIRVPSLIKPYLRELIDSMAENLNTDAFTKLYKQNEQMFKHFAKTVSITLGRLATIDPQTSAYCLPKIIKPWCISLRYISGSDEKVQAFKGLCSMIPYNPIGIADSFPYFCEALIEFKEPP
jgi:transportin-1